MTEAVIKILYTPPRTFLKTLQKQSHLEVTHLNTNPPKSQVFKGSNLIF